MNEERQNAFDICLERATTAPRDRGHVCLGTVGLVAQLLARETEGLLCNISESRSD